MTIEVNLQQAEYIIDKLSGKEIVPIRVNKEVFLSTLKEAVKKETIIQQDEIDKILQRVQSNGMSNVEFISNLSKAKETITSESKKTRNKYFDEEGNEKK